MNDYGGQGLVIVTVTTNDGMGMKSLGALGTDSELTFSPHRGIR